MHILQSFKSLTRFERTLWLVSLGAVLLSAAFSGFSSPLPCAASLIGVTALIFVAKGNVLGQILTVVFALFYGMISYTFHYYGEMITYMGMTAPIAAMAVVSWLRHPYDKQKQEVAVNRLSRTETVLMWVCAVLVTVLFYFILAFFETPNLIPSTLSVTFSFLASYLTFRRSPYYALGYAANDLILIVLWSLATAEESRYLAMVVCFVLFFVNDSYGFLNWRKMAKRQQVLFT